MLIVMPHRFREFSKIKGNESCEDAVDDISRKISVGKHIVVPH